MGVWHGDVAWECGMGMWHGDVAWGCGMRVWHGSGVAQQTGVSYECIL